MKQLPDGYTYQYPFDEFGDVDPDIGEAASLLAKKNDLGITSDRELAGVLLLEGKVVGATWTSTDDESYSFDVLVDSARQGKGLGDYLLDQVVEIPDETLDIYPDIKLDVYVINNVMQKMLQKRGFEVTETVPHGVLMQENEILKRAVAQGFDVTKVWYHATDHQFEVFDIDKSADTCLWLAESQKDLLAGEHAAAGLSYIVPVFIHTDKLVGWDDYDKYTLDQLIAQNKDGALLDDAVMYLHPEKARSIHDDFLTKNKTKSMIINPELQINAFEKTNNQSPDTPSLPAGRRLKR
jgi:ribosomal protein S18 acetylase RimI-like enzyme